MGILLIIIIILFLCWPTIMKWTGRFMAKRAEDYLRKATGMPPRPGSREARRQEKARPAGDPGAGRSRSQHYSRSGSRRYGETGNDPIIPKEYAEDVDFTETIDYSETTIAEDNTLRGKPAYHENQVSDVEWEEVKPSKGKGR